MSHPQYTESEAKQHGIKIYEQEVISLLTQDNRGAFVIIDPETGEYVIGGDFMEVMNRLQSKNPGVHLYAVHMGMPETGRILRRLYSWTSLSYRTIDGVKPTQEMIDNARQRGAERYEQIRRQVEPGNDRKLVVINTQTGEYTVGDDLPKMLKSPKTSNVISYTHRIGFLGYRALGYRATLNLLGAKISRNVSPPTAFVEDQPPL